MKAQIQVDAREFLAWQKGLKERYPKAYKQAVKGTLDGLAFEARRHATTVALPQKLTLRNKFTQKTVQYSKAKGNNIAKMESWVGQVDKIGQTETGGYLAKHEMGGVIRPKKHKSLLKATLTARSGRYSRRVAKRYLIKNLQINSKLDQKKEKRGKKKERYTVLKPFTLTLKRGGTGIFVRTGSKPGQMKMIYNLETKRQIVRASRWLTQSQKTAIDKRAQIFQREMDRALAKRL